MKAIIYHNFKSQIVMDEVPDPVAADDGVVIQVKASGICRSDWHGWMGHDPDISKFPHVPGHEFSGIVVETGKDVKSAKAGDRVTVPFVCGCGKCRWCSLNEGQICNHQFQPGFTHWGSFAEYVSIHHADFNIVKIPDTLEFTTAAALGCRFITSFRGLIHQGKLQPGNWVSIFGCGGVGLSAIMIAKAFQAKIIAVDIHEPVLQLAESIGADISLNAKSINDIPAEIHQITDGGVDLSMDCLGSTETSTNSILSLRKQGRHIQIGLMAGKDFHPSYPAEKLISGELKIIGSHGMQASRYPEILELISDSRIQPDRIIGNMVSLSEVPEEIMTMDQFRNVGITIIDRF